jgi:hypothetical protein
MFHPAQEFIVFEQFFLLFLTFRHGVHHPGQAADGADKIVNVDARWPTNAIKMA